MTSGRSRSLGVWALIALAASLLVLGLLIAFAERLARFNITTSIFYVLLVGTAVCAAAALFGVLHSRAVLKGETGMGAMELGGAAAFAVVLVWMGLTFASPPVDLDVVVSVRDKSGSRIAGSAVVVSVGRTTRDGVTDARGDAHFSGIVASASAGIDVRAEAAGFQPASQTLTGVPANRLIVVTLEHVPEVSELRGTLRDEAGAPVAGATLVIEGGLARGRSDDTGAFNFQVPRLPGSQVRLNVLIGDRLGFDNYITLPGPMTLTVRR